MTPTRSWLPLAALRVTSATQAPAASIARIAIHEDYMGSMRGSRAGGCARPAGPCALPPLRVATAAALPGLGALRVASARLGQQRRGLFPGEVRPHRLAQVLDRAPPLLGATGQSRPDPLVGAHCPRRAGDRPRARPHLPKLLQA